MKFKIFAGLVFVFSILCFATNSPGVDDESLKSPSAFLPAEEYEFKPVVDGVEITHDFIIQNRGTAPLIIQKVKSG